MAAGGRRASPPQMNPPTPASLCLVRRRRRRWHSQSAPDPTPVTAAKAPLTRVRRDQATEGARAALARGGEAGLSHPGTPLRWGAGRDHDIIGGVGSWERKMAVGRLLGVEVIFGSTESNRQPGAITVTLISKPLNYVTQYQVQAPLKYLQGW